MNKDLESIIPHFSTKGKAQAALLTNSTKFLKEN